MTKCYPCFNSCGELEMYLYQELVRRVDVLLRVEAGRVVGHCVLGSVPPNVMFTFPKKLDR